MQQPTGELSLSAFIGSPKDPSGLSNSQKSVPIVYSEDNSNETKKNEMEAMAACTKDDVLFRNWLIRFVNSQMLLKGCETQGHLILSAAKTEILSQIHMPVWKDQTLTSKTSWSGKIILVKNFHNFFFYFWKFLQDPWTVCSILPQLYLKILLKIMVAFMCPTAELTTLLFYQIEP